MEDFFTCDNIEYGRADLEALNRVWCRCVYRPDRTDLGSFIGDRLIDWYDMGIEEEDELEHLVDEAVASLDSLDDD